MALQWLKQPNGTLVLWDPAKGGAPLSSEPDKGSQAMPDTDTTEVARSLLEDGQGTRSPDLLTKLLSSGGAPADTSPGEDKIDYTHLIMALLGSSVNAAPAGEEGGQSVGATTPEGAGYSPAEPTTGVESKGRLPAAAKDVKGYAGAEAFVKGMIKRGWTPSEAAGAAGNVHVESGFKPGVKSSVPGEQSFGFLQWNKDRLQGLKNYAASKGMDRQSPEAQMDWINLERTGGSVKYGGTDESGAYKKALSAGGTPEQIAARFGQYVERPKDLSQSVRERMGAAMQYAKFGGVGGTPAQPPANVVAAAQHDKVPYTNQTVDQELMSAILGGTTWG